MEIVKETYKNKSQHLNNNQNKKTLHNSKNTATPPWPKESLSLTRPSCTGSPGRQDAINPKHHPRNPHGKKHEKTAPASKQEDEKNCFPNYGILNFNKRSVISCFMYGKSNDLRVFYGRLLCPAHHHLRWLRKCSRLGGGPEFQRENLASCWPTAGRWSGRSRGDRNYLIFLLNINF